jgi:glycosyltransferase involved in cell wall biosynthesis
VGYLRATLDSVLPQLRPGDSIVLCANGSTDEYVRELKELAGGPVSLVVSPLAGVAHARNFGFEQSQSEYVMFLDDDDLMLPNALESLRSKLNSNPDVIAVTGNVTLFNERGDTPSQSRQLGDADLDWEMLMGGMPTATLGAALFRRSALQPMQRADQSLSPADDWDFWLNVAEAGRIVSISNITLRYRIHTGNISANVPLMAMQALRVFRRHEHRGKLPAARLANAFNRSRDWYLGRLRDQFRKSAKAGNIVAALRCVSVAASLNIYYTALRLGIT